MTCRLIFDPVAFSDITPRTDKEHFQKNIEYINAVMTRKFDHSDSIYTVRNSIIVGKKYTAIDGVHLTDPGVSKLAAHIKDAVVDALELE